LGGQGETVDGKLMGVAVEAFVSPLQKCLESRSKHGVFFGSNVVETSKMVVKKPSQNGA